MNVARRRIYSEIHQVANSLMRYEVLVFFKESNAHDFFWLPSIVKAKSMHRTLTESEARHVQNLDDAGFFSLTGFVFILDFCLSDRVTRSWKTEARERK